MVCRLCGFLLKQEEKFCRGCGAAAVPQQVESSGAVPNVVQQARARTQNDFFDTAPRASVATQSRPPLPLLADVSVDGSRSVYVTPTFAETELDLVEKYESAQRTGGLNARKHAQPKTKSRQAEPVHREAAKPGKAEPLVSGNQPAAKKQFVTALLFVLVSGVAGIAYFMLASTQSQQNSTPPSVSISTNPIWNRRQCVPSSQSARSRLSTETPSVNVRQLIAQETEESLTSKFTLLLAASVAVGIALVAISAKIFGHNGVLNILEKNSYIPSQVRGQHRKILKELGAAPTKGALPLGLPERNALQFWLPQQLTLPAKRRERNPNALLLGAAGFGKSRLLERMIRQDILDEKRAVVVLDSEGTLVDRLVAWIADQNCDDISERVVVLDPASRKSSAGFNPLLAPDDGLNQMASAVVSGFKCIYMEAPGAQNQWTQQTANILRNAVILLSINKKTLADLPRLLSDNDFRDECLSVVEKSTNTSRVRVVLEAWSNYKKLARSDQWLNWIEPILNRIQPVLCDDRVRSLLCSPDHSVDLIDVLEKKKIVLVRVPRVQFEQGAALPGSLLVTGIRHAAVQLSEGHQENPHPCTIFVDELTDFVDKDCFESIATDSRLLQMGIIGTMRSLQSVGDDFKNALVKSIGVLIAFALIRKDAEALGGQMFRVDGRKTKNKTISNRVNPLNSSPGFELISDEQSLNVDRLTGQEERSFYCYLVGSVAGVFKLRAPTVDEVECDEESIERLYQSQYEED